MHAYYSSQEPPLPPAFAHEEDRDRSQQGNFSTATVIDHGSPPASPSRNYFRTRETLVFSGDGDGNAGRQGVASLGLTKDEWLRLGGFLGDNDSVQGDRPPATPHNHLPYLGDVGVVSVSGDFDNGFTLPTPPAAAPALPDPASCRLPAPPPAWYSDPPPLAPKPLLPPPPPPHLRTWEPYSDEPASLVVNRSPARSERRRAPSPIQATRIRPTPYPTVTGSAAGGGESTAADIVVAKPDAPVTTAAAAGEVDPPLPTPVRTVLANYSEYPLPSAPPSPIPPPEGKKKKRHGRKMSADHIPRPRNAFILFRSHAITSGLIPHSIGVKDHKNLSQIVGGVWRGLSEPERQQWEVLAEEEKRRHVAKYPNYAYRPKQKATPRAPPGQGKKAKARAARLAAEYAAVPGANERFFVLPERDVESRTDSPTAGTEADHLPRSPRSELPSQLPTWEQDPVARHRARETRRMDLIAQAVLEGEQDDLVMQRVERQLEAEMGPAPVPVPSTSRADDIRVDESASRPKRPKRTRSGPVTPRKTRTVSAQGAPVVGAGVPAAPNEREDEPEHETTPTKQPEQPPPPVRALYTSPTSSDSTLSPSPFRRGAVCAQNGQRQPISPASSDSPSPVRMQLPPQHGSGSAPMARGSSGAAGSAGRRHPLSRSQSAAAAMSNEEGGHSDDDLPAARRQRTDSYTCLGIAADSSPLTVPGGSAQKTTDRLPGTDHPSPGYAFPAHCCKSSAEDVPLFAGPADSRHFSLGRWEVRKLPAAVPSRREMLAQQIEEEETEGCGTAEEATARPADMVAPTASFLFKPSDFLVDTGFEAAPAGEGLVDPRATLLPPAESDRALSGERDDDRDEGSTEYGTAYSPSVFDAWHSDAASSSLCYETASSSAGAQSSMRMAMLPGALVAKYGPPPPGLFRLPSSAAAGPSLFAAQQQQHLLYSHAESSPGDAATALPSSATATAGAASPPTLLSGEEDLFHFGSEDLFAQPPPALSSLFHEDDLAARTVSSMFVGDATGSSAGMTTGGEGGFDEPFGLGLGIALPL